MLRGLAVRSFGIPVAMLGELQQNSYIEFRSGSKFQFYPRGLTHPPLIYLKEDTYTELEKYQKLQFSDVQNIMNEVTNAYFDLIIEPNKKNPDKKWIWERVEMASEKHFQILIRGGVSVAKARVNSLAMMDEAMSEIASEIALNISRGIRPTIASVTAKPLHNTSFLNWGLEPYYTAAETSVDDELIHLVHWLYWNGSKKPATTEMGVLRALLKHWYDPWKKLPHY